MNSKGQMGKTGMLVVLAVTLIVGAIFLQVIAQSAGESTTLSTVANGTLGTFTDNNTAIVVTDYKSCSDLMVWNATGDVEVPAAQYTQTNNVVTNGALSFTVLPDVAADTYFGEWTYDGTCQPLTYESNSGGRAMISLIVVMFALALLAVALYPVIKDAEWMK